MDYYILVVDDEQDFLDSVRRGLITAGFRNVRTETDPRAAASLFDADGIPVDIALIDVMMPDMDGVDLLTHIKNRSPQTECLMVTAMNDAQTAVECLKKGAYDYLVKPVAREDLVKTLHRTLEKRILYDLLTIQKNVTATKLLHPEAFKAILTRSPNVQSTLKEAELHAMSDIPILITGESGTGKELLARAIHDSSPRARYPFTPVNMASMPETLFDAAFHGSVRGAFTGATENRAGYLEQTHQGTLFMDEIGNIPLVFQEKLLRVIEGGEFVKLGTGRARKVDVRFIAATNMDLDSLIGKGLFRKDFYYRVKGAWLHLPPLRDRPKDIPLLIQKFLHDFSGPAVAKTIDDQALSLLMDHDYPGNVRELKSIIQSAGNLAQDGQITVHCLPASLRRQKSPVSGRPRISGMPASPLQDIEKDHILKVYEAVARNKVKAAAMLKIGLNTLRRRLKSYGID